MQARYAARSWLSRNVQDRKRVVAEITNSVCLLQAEQVSLRSKSMHRLNRIKLNLKQEIHC